ncbi:MAG: hypothetical protein NVS3B25_14320 [Hymenobacter sp.]
MYIRNPANRLAMRHLLTALLLLNIGPALAQPASPVIDRTDLPVPGDTLRLSTAAALPASAPPLTQRGPAQTWNYAALAPTAQRVERYVALSATAPAYQFTFGLLGGVNRATVAAPQPLPAVTGTALPFSDPYQFYSVTASGAAVQDFRSVGFGATVGGFSLPVTYASQAQQDVIYRLPLSYASLPDSSSSFFATPTATAGVGYLSQKRKRVNRVDAWGMLTTPFGTFQTVRVVSKLTDHDSVAFGGAPGTGANLPVTREYKWLAKAQHVPLLTIITQQVAGREVVTTVEYRDIYRRLVRLAARDAAIEAALAVYPNPSAVGSPLTLAVPPGSGPLTVSATDLVGRQLFRRSVPTLAGVLSLSSDAFGAFRGVALLTVATRQGTATRWVVRE